MTVKLLTAEARQAVEDRIAKTYEKYHFLINNEPETEKRRPSWNSKSDYWGGAWGSFKSLLSSQSGWDKESAQPEIVRLSPEHRKMLLNTRAAGHLVLYRNAFFLVKGLLTEEDARLLVVREVEWERESVEKAKSVPRQEQESTGERKPIPQKVRQEVWRRDQGKCQRCGSREKLEFDHIVPVVKGGSNTARNIELLCEACNRQKSGGIS